MAYAVHVEGIQADFTGHQSTPLVVVADDLVFAPQWVIEGRRQRGTLAGEFKFGITGGNQGFGSGDLCFGQRHRAWVGFSAFKQGGGYVDADLQVAKAADHVRVIAGVYKPSGTFQQLARLIQGGHE